MQNVYQVTQGEWQASGFVPATKTSVGKAISVKGSGLMGIKSNPHVYLHGRKVPYGGKVKVYCADCPDGREYEFMGTLQWGKGMFVERWKSR